MSSTARSHAERIHTDLREQILNGEIPQGHRLVVRTYAAKYGTSDLPVREAIRRLEGDGLVEVHQNRGASVRHLTAEEIPGTYIVRGELEGLATRLAGPHLDQSDLAELWQLNEAMKTAADGGEAADYNRLNHEFHTLIFNRCPYKEVTDTILRIWSGQAAFGMVFGIDARRMATSIKEHEGIVESLERKDWFAAGDLAREHKWSTARSLLELMDLEIPPELMPVSAPAREP